MISNLELFKVCVHVLMKFGPHGSKIHWLLNNFIVVLHLSKLLFNIQSSMVI